MACGEPSRLATPSRCAVAAAAADGVAEAAGAAGEDGVAAAGGVDGAGADGVRAGVGADSGVHVHGGRALGVRRAAASTTAGVNWFAVVRHGAGPCGGEPLVVMIEGPGVSRAFCIHWAGYETF